MYWNMQYSLKKFQSILSKKLNINGKHYYRDKIHHYKLNIEYSKFQSKLGTKDRSKCFLLELMYWNMQYSLMKIQSILNK